MSKTRTQKNVERKMTNKNENTKHEIKMRTSIDWKQEFQIVDAFFIFIPKALRNIWSYSSASSFITNVKESDRLISHKAVEILSKTTYKST